MKSTKPVNGTVQTFNKLADDYWAESFERFPIMGGGVGIKKYQSQLGRATAETWTEQAALARRTLDRLAKLPVHDFEGDAWLDRLTLRSHLLSELGRLEDRKTWRVDPQVHIESVADAIHGLVIRHAENLKPVAAAILERLAQIPAYLDEAIEVVKNPTPLWSELACEAAGGMRSLFESLREPLARAAGARGAEAAPLIERASAAAELYGKRLQRKKPGPVAQYSLGRERFERMMRDRLGLDWSAGEAVAAAAGLAARLQAELKEEARRFHPKKAPHEILDEARANWTFSGANLLEAYQKETFRIRDRFEAAGAMTFPDHENLLVKPVPDFMAPVIPTAAYSGAGALEKDQTGIFWVNDMSLRRKGEAEKRREIEQHFGLEITAAHEAYPGHHLQFVFQHRHPSLTRKLANHSIYYEGWTLWCEQMTVDLKVTDNPHIRLIQLHDALWRANRIIIDCGLHTGALSLAAARKQLQEAVGFTAGRARAEINWYSSAPTVPMSYLLGKMELMRLKRRKVDQEGWTLKRFNDWVLGFGSIPWSWIEASGL